MSHKLTLAELEQADKLRRAGESYRAIARAIGRVTDKTVKHALEQRFEIESDIRAMISHLNPKEVARAVGPLSDRDRVILFERLLSDRPCTLEEIAEKTGLTRQGVYWVEKSMLKKIEDKFFST